MALNIGSGGLSREPEVMVEINTTPLIDVMLVLLIMLIITIPIQLHSVNLSMSANSLPATLPEVVQIDIDSDGTISWNGVMVDRPALEAKLRVIAEESPQTELHLRPNTRVAYKNVAAVMAAAQRLGVSKIGLIGNDEFLQ
ncbi:MAG: biopolymer transporter ExbD [Burkholderiales bacterium]|nr:biopolymer transporter ExbD [Burkholderiales bacterium]